MGEAEGVRLMDDVVVIVFDVGVMVFPVSDEGGFMGACLLLFS